MPEEQRGILSPGQILSLTAGLLLCPLYQLDQKTNKQIKIKRERETCGKKEGLEEMPVEQPILLQLNKGTTPEYLQLKWLLREVAGYVFSEWTTG